MGTTLKIQFPFDGVHTDLGVFDALKLYPHPDDRLLNFDRHSIVRPFRTGIKAKFVFSFNPFVEPPVALPEGTTNGHR